ncbi:hypothetical protein PG993_003466 [Apiospora rasikravindrae]|uniref:Uncharacterized protein n=1 Tax=Apiospora rasikravindrae TaxID=990691 RepID=A0ABR1TZL7_9PEZI
MPLRQLQRPLLRTTIAAAAAAASTSWRPISVQLQHGSSSCCRYSSSATSSSTDASSQQKPPQPKKTLFEELFPDESKTGSSSSLRRTLNGSSKNHKDEDVEPEPLALPEEFQAYANDPDADVRSAYDNRALLVLSGAPKSLTESDFFRTQLGGPARHVEGWSSAGIHRIIPMRDPETLEPAGQYYIVFESGVAAAAWQEEVSTLWRLARARNWSRQLVTGDSGSFESRQLQRLLADAGKKPKKKKKDQKYALGKTDKHHSLAGYETLTHDEGEDGNDLESASVRNFTLIPQSQRYDIERPLYTRLDSLLHNGAPSLVERLMDKAGSRHLVLLVLEGGRLSIPTLRALIHEDGAERNLAWRVKGLDRDYSDSQRGGGGIMAFGKSSLKASEQAGPEESLLRQIKGAMGEEGGSKGGNRTGGAAAAPELALASLSRTARERQKLNHENRRWNRFIVPFLDEAEARRFVRHWHRRQLQLKMGHEDSDVKTWEESRTINASILW